jgi:Transcriptional regulators
MTEIATMGFLYQAKVLFPTEIALMAKIRVQSMSQLLKKLEKQKLIKRTPSKEDRRKTYISLTDKGKHKVEITRYERDEWLANAIKKSLSENEKQTIIDAIKILNKLAEIK